MERPKASVHNVPPNEYSQSAPTTSIDTQEVVAFSILNLHEARNLVRRRGLTWFRFLFGQIVRKQG